MKIIIFRCNDVDISYREGDGQTILGSLFGECKALYPYDAARYFLKYRSVDNADETRLDDEGK